MISKRGIPNCDRVKVVKCYWDMLKLKTDSPFCENFEDLGVTKSCLVGEDCYVGKCKYFELYIKKTVHISAF